MRTILRSLVLLALLLAYGTQAVEQTKHVHLSGDRHHCTACVFGSVPGEPTARIAEPLPPGLLAIDWGHRAWRQPPPVSLEILDVSASTSPPSL